MENSYPNVLQVSDIQKILMIGRRQAYDLVNSGEFHVIRIGRTIRVENEVFENWMKGGLSKAN